jgi:hypothetical protein
MVVPSTGIMTAVVLRPFKSPLHICSVSFWVLSGDPFTGK